MRSLLGRGSDSVVYCVVDLAIDEQIAVKLINDPVGGVDRLKNEARIARRVTHPNVCRVFDIIEHHDGVLLSMEYVAGGTLADASPDAEAVESIAEQLLDGLEACHAAGVLHRDIKPANILLRANPGPPPGRAGRAVLSDFGVSRSPAEALGPPSQALVGSPAYMAPEQLARAEIDERTDLYALGLVLYELSTGALPFADPEGPPTVADVRRRALSNVPPLSPRRFHTGLARMLARDPADRPQNVEAARKALGLTKPSRRRFIAVGAAVAVAAVALFAIRRDPPQPKLRTLTSGDEAFTEPAAFTPDGARLIIASNRTGSFQLWSISVADGSGQPVTASARGCHFPHFASGVLHYLRDRDDGRYDLVRLVKGKAVLVQANVGYAHVAAGRVLSMPAPLGHDVPQPLHLTGLDGQRTVLLDDGHPVRWAFLSPDASRVAFVQNDELSVMSTTGERRRRIATNVVGANGFSWAPDGQSLAFLRGSRDERALVSIRADGADERVVATRLRGATSPSHSPDGRLAYVVDEIEYGIWTSDGHTPFSRLTFAGDRAATSPTWVSSQSAIAYTMRDPDGGAELIIARGPAFSEIVHRRKIRPYSISSVAVRGRYAVYVERTDDTFELRRTVIDGDIPPETLASSRWPELLLAPHFVGDERVGFVRAAGDQTSIYDVATDGSDERLRRKSAGGGFASSDGTHMAYQDESGLHVAKLDDSWRITVPKGPPIHNYRFQIGSRRLFLSDASGLAMFDPDTGVRQRILHWPPGALYPDRPAVDPDGRVAVELGVGRFKLVVIDNFAGL